MNILNDIRVSEGVKELELKVVYLCIRSLYHILEDMADLDLLSDTKVKVTLILFKKIILFSH